MTTMPTTTAMYTRIRAADGKNTTTAIGITCRTPGRHSLSTPNSRRGSGVMSAPLPPLGAREAGAVASAASIVVREAVGASTVVVDSAGSVVVGTVEASVVSVAEEVGGAVALADLVAGSVDSAAEGSGGRRIDQLKIGKAKSEIISNDQESERRIRVKAGMKMRDSKLRSQLFERIEDLHARSAKVSVAASDDGEVVPPGRSRNVAVFNRHAPARPLQLPLLFGPNVRDRSVEAENPSVQCSHQASQPCLQRLPLPSLFAAHPVGKLRQDCLLYTSPSPRDS